MITNILVWYLIGVMLAYPSLLISNTIEVNINKGGEDGKAELYYIFLSFILIFILSLYVIHTFHKKLFPLEKIKKFFNKKPHLIINKKISAKV